MLFLSVTVLFVILYIRNGLDRFQYHLLFFEFKFISVRPTQVTSKSYNQGLSKKMCLAFMSKTSHQTQSNVARHVNRDLITLGNRLSILINSVYIVWVRMCFCPDTHLLKSYLGDNVRTTTSIYHQFIIFPRVCNISVEHTRPTLVLIFNSCV